MLPSRFEIIKKDDGGALISVVLVALLLALLATGVLQVMLNARHTIHSVEVNDADLRIARSALRLFMKEHFYNADEKAFLQDTVSVMGRETEVRVEFESGRININRANATLLSALFVVAGKSQTEAQDIAAAIIDWRDKDDESRIGGAELEQYIEAGRMNGPRNGPFEAVGELNYVLGMDEDLFLCVQPFLSVSSLTGEVDLSFAGGEIRSVLQWAHDNRWEDMDWPNPANEEQGDNVIGSSNVLAGQSLRLTISVPSEDEKTYDALIRFKSTSDMSYTYLSPVRRKSLRGAVTDCPW